MVDDSRIHTSVKDEIIGRLDELTAVQLVRVLELVRTISVSRLPPAKPVENLLRFAGSIPPKDLAAMSEAIEDCEQIDPDEWDKPIFPD